MKNPQAKHKFHSNWRSKKKTEWIQNCFVVRKRSSALLILFLKKNGIVCHRIPCQIFVSSIKIEIVERKRSFELFPFISNVYSNNFSLWMTRKYSKGHHRSRRWTDAPNGFTLFTFQIQAKNFERRWQNGLLLLHVTVIKFNV